MYVLAAGEFAKVGITGNITKRVATVQTACPLEVTLVGHVVLAHRDAVQCETEFLAYLKSTGAHVRGEWFKADAADIMTRLRCIAVDWQ